MTVYVDQPIHKYGQMIMCHMISESEEELHAMADKIGIKKKWYQSNASFPHYDICKSKRALAIEHGAVEVTSRQLVQVIRKIKSGRSPA